MAINPISEPDPVEEEGVRLLNENPELLADLEEFERQLDAGEVECRDNNDEARRIVGLDPPSD